MRLLNAFLPRDAALPSGLRALAAATLLGALAAPAPALAGGIGLVGTGGGHTDRVYSYTQNAAGDWEQDDPVNQFGPNFGGGLEFVLGDRDNKVLGVIRGTFVQDAPQKELETGRISPVRDEPLNQGIITGGLQWGVLGDPTGLQGVVVANVGAAVFTEDLTSFITGEVGVGGTWMPDRHIQVAATVVGAARINGIRYKNRIMPAANAYVGVRYLFD